MARRNGRGETVLSSSGAILLLLAAVLSDAQAVEFGHVEPEVSAVALQLDNDLFAGTERDADYTGGFSVLVAGRSAREGWLSLERMLRRIDGWTGSGRHPQGAERHARQVGYMAFTPEDIATTEVQPHERPYASLLFIANGRTRLSPDRLDAWTTTLTAGVLGLDPAADLHEAVHDAIGTPAPRGYAHQISAGGEPTFRYSVARQHLVFLHPSGRVEVTGAVAGSVGYLTEAAASVSLRAGELASPWWGQGPALGSYLDNPVPIELAPRGATQRFVVAGLRVRARAYNALLQGQFRHSDVTVSSDDVARLIVDAWAGIGLQFAGGMQMSYVLRYQTREITRGPAARNSLWAALQVSRRF